MSTLRILEQFFIIRTFPLLEATYKGMYVALEQVDRKIRKSTY